MLGLEIENAIRVHMYSKPLGSTVGSSYYIRLYQTIVTDANRRRGPLQ